MTGVATPVIERNKIFVRCDVCLKRVPIQNSNLAKPYITSVREFASLIEFWRIGIKGKGLTLLCSSKEEIFR
ncbi:hypothetical protein NIES2107_14660 [Nostoc carneum NIES-2107]|nr:hypothetical protein NIES2107_14660 [Nostoc carneum NIES-2107]